MSDAAVTAASPATSMQLVPLSAITESATNPRRQFDKAALDELADSIRAHGVLSPVLLRPVKDGFELVAGARRFRAARAAGLAEIPAVVRELDDRAMLEVQVIENLQRSDLHPLEEAQGYRLLTQQHGYSVDEIAAKVGKSKAYVYARLKLCDLPKGAQKLFHEGKLDASRALLVARIPDAKLAEEAAKEIAGTRWRHDEPMSFRRAIEHVQEQYMLRLADAPFATGDKDLVPAAGACGACPKRTGNQKGLFDDVRGADVCTDPTCFRAKVDAHWRRRRPELEAKGVRILEGKAADRAGYSSEYERLDRKCWEDKKGRTYRQLLKGVDVDLVVRRDRDGKEEELVPRAALAKALREAGHSFAKKTAARATGPKSKGEKQHELRGKAIAATVEDLVAKAEAFDDEKGFLRFLVDDLLSGHAEPLRIVGKRRDLNLTRTYGRGDRDDDKLPAATQKVIDAMTAGQLRGLAVELIALDYANPGYSSGYGAGWTRACKLLGIDMRKREAAVAKQEKEKAEAKKKPAKGRSKPAAKRAAKRARKKAAAAASGEDSGVRTCRECGCTDARACAGGCEWVDDDLCSACSDGAL